MRQGFYGTFGERESSGHANTSFLEMEKKVLKMEFEVLVVLRTEYRDRARMRVVEVNRKSSGRRPVAGQKFGTGLEMIWDLFFLVEGGEADQNEN